jgi:ATP-binding cassette subfamily F protein uup
LGSVRLGSNIAVAYFDQLREELDGERSVAETVNPGSDWVEVGGERRHVVSYLGDFLFSPQRLDSPVRLLSGGERNRLLLARLFAKPANVLVLDEPTNDLDIESLELLEDTLQRYAGTLLLVSHDRAFLDNVVTQVLAPLGDGRWHEYVGGYSDWVAQRPAASAKPGRVRGEARATTLLAKGSGDPGAQTRGDARTKLSYRETRELAELPDRIQALESEQQALHAAMAEPRYHERGAAGIKADRERVATIEQELAAAYERWSALDARSTRP